MLKVKYQTYEAGLNGYGRIAVTKTGLLADWFDREKSGVHGIIFDLETKRCEAIHIGLIFLDEEPAKKAK